MVVVTQPAPPGVMRRVFTGLGAMIITGSFLLNFVLLGSGGAGGDFGGKVREETLRRASPGAARVAVVPVEGLIDFSAAERLRVMLEHAAEDSSVKAVVLSVNSPGGYVTASDEAFRHVKAFKARSGGKPLAVQMRGVAASGGYYLSVPADRIFAEPTTVTGSIGVMAEWFGVDGLLKQIKVEHRTFRSRDRKGRGGPFEPLGEADLKEYAEQLEYDHQLFIDAVADGRSAVMTRAEVEKAADGSAYNAKQAKELKLIDDIGYRDDSVAWAAGKAGLTGDYGVVLYKPGGVGGLAELLGVSSTRTPSQAQEGSAGNGLLPSRDGLTEMMTPRRMYLAPLR
jgi:protease-4